MRAALFSAEAVRHTTDNLERSLSETITALRHCERHVVAATDDADMQEATERTLIEVARILAVIGRLIEWECGDLAKLTRWAEEAAQQQAGRGVE